MYKYVYIYVHILTDLKIFKEHLNLLYLYVIIIMFQILFDYIL